MTDTPTPSAALIAEARKLRDHLRGLDSDSGEAHLLDRLADGVAFAVDALAAAKVREARLRRSLQTCVDAHDTGRFEPAQAAYRGARAALEGGAK